jgi:isochorismate pyruvate lyase
MSKNPLEKARQDIDKIDEKMIKLVGKRFELVDKVISYKSKNGMRAHQPKRFAQVIKSRRKLAKKHGLDPDCIEGMWRELIAHITKLEEKKIREQKPNQN